MSQPATTLRFTFLGVTASVTTCDCCGRPNLAKTIALRENESGEVVYYGAVCGAKAIGWGVKEFNAAAKHAQVEAEQAAFILYRDAAKALMGDCAGARLGIYSEEAKAAGRAAVLAALPTYTGYYSLAPA